MRPAGDERTPADRLSRLVLAYDGSPYAEEALSRGRGTWLRPGRRGWLRRQSRKQRAPPRPRWTRPCPISDSRALTRAASSKGAQSGPAGVARSILHVALEQGSDLLVLGDTGFSPFVELFVRSTFDHMLREAGCSVMVCG
ncbi:MAG: universal stress protein [Anaerolineae bacterium]